MAQVVRARFPGVLSTIGDPVLAVIASDRVLYASLASRTALGAVPRDTLVVFRTDNCGEHWDVANVPLITADGDVSQLDRPSIFVDPANPMRVLLGISKERWSYHSVSDDGGLANRCGFRALFPRFQRGDVRLHFDRRSDDSQ